MLTGNGKGMDGDGGHHQNQRTDWFCARTDESATVSRFMTKATLTACRRRRKRPAEH
jgi:hypothetical protein